MALRTLTVEFTKVTGEEIVTIKTDKVDEFGEDLDPKAVIKAGKRYIAERIGYSGAIRVRVR
jgi:hypothetical protein